jgi:anthranilate phosphoribosyltransferase
MDNLHNLSSQQYRVIFDNIIDNKLDENQIKTFLLNLNQIDYPTNAFIGAIQSFRPKCKNTFIAYDILDVCGTGGDKLNTLNISTAVAFVVAGYGVAVAKHGNRAISSRSGSADVLIELGINITIKQSEIVNSLTQNNLCFMFAPLYHNSFKSLAKIRLELAIPTIFNFLGPLLNPANAKYQLIGTSKKSTMLPMLESLKTSGSEKVFIVHGMDGMDEITISNNSLLISLENGKISNQQIINPEVYGIKKSPLSQIKGGSAKYNAKKIIDLLDGEESPYLDIVVLNSAFALMIAGRASSIENGIKIARNTIKNGRAKQILQKYQNTIIAI